MDTLNIAFYQMDMAWEDSAKNLSYLDSVLQNLRQETEVLVLPEMFTTGFSMNSQELAETMDGETVEWMKQKSKLLNCAIGGSIIIEEHGQYWNRFVWVEPSGRIESYDKRHLFSMAEESDYYSAGEQKQLIVYKGWKICPLICYDIRFPMWSRNQEEYDLLIYVASWPKKRTTHWKKLLDARAIENQSYVLGVNRFGIDGNDIFYSGDSKLVDPYGEIVVEVSDKESLQYCALSKSKLVSVRTSLPFLKDRDKFTIA